MNTIDALASGDVLKHDAVQYLEYNHIYIKLLMNKQQAIFNRRHADNQRREAEAAAKRRR